MSHDLRVMIEERLGGQYDVQRELGRGGMGVVYLARERRLDRLVAIKVLPPALDVADVRERFLREARTAAQLSHPNIVPIFRADEIDGLAFFSMGFVDGESFADRIQTLGRVPVGEVVRVLRDAAWALAYAHARGVIHRDVKPENLMIERSTGRVIVTDFGIARDTRASNLTQEGWILGSVHYMSPEQAAGDELDGRSDLYALGVIGWQALTGRLPFAAEQASAVLVQHATRPAPPLQGAAPDVPRQVAAVIERCLAKSPADRFPSGEAFAEALTTAWETAEREPGAKSAAVVAVSSEQAQAIWRRASELQAEAATRVQKRYRTAAAPPDQETRVPTDSYRLKDVEAAAIEAGIGSEFVALAIAEQGAALTAPSAAGLDRNDRLYTTLLGTRARSVSVARTIPATARNVLETIGRVFPVAPFFLSFRETVGGHPVDGGVVIFKVKRMQAAEYSTANYSSFLYRMTQIDLPQLSVTMRQLGGPTPATEVSVYGDLRPGLRRNLKWDFGFAGTAAAGGVAAGSVIGGAALGLGVLTALPAVGAGALFGTGMLAWYRWYYRRGLAKATEELESLLLAVESSITAQSVFGGTPMSGRILPPESSASGDGARQTKSPPY
ncbi:MAG: serine/threonine-protein kinase [Gemmatimonadales bacterium]